MKPDIIIPVLLMTTLLCGCGRESKAPNQSTSSPPVQPSVARQPAGDTSSDPVEELALGDYVSFPACEIKIRQPEGFEEADTFDGFGQPETQSSIMAMSIPGPYSEVASGFTQKQMKARRWTLLSRQDVKVDGLPGILVHFEQPAGGQVFVKWSLAFGDDRKTTLVTATFPKAQDRELSARLKSTVLSTRMDRAVSIEPGTALPFTIAASPKLKVTPPGISKVLVYTRDGAIPAKSPKDPLFIVAPSLGIVQAGDKREFAERRLRQTAHVNGLVVMSTESITIDGLDGYESFAEAVDAESKTPLRVYQVILFNEGSYILMQGLIGAELRDEYQPEFKAMARSFQRRQP